MIDDAEMPMIKKSNELLIQVKAASLSVTDIKICSGYSKIYRKLLNSGVSVIPQKFLIAIFQLYFYNKYLYVFFIYI
jgi:hypothetical protein